MKKTVTCGVCNKPGHNARSHASKKTTPPLKTPHSYTPLGKLKNHTPFNAFNGENFHLSGKPAASADVSGKIFHTKNTEKEAVVDDMVVLWNIMGSQSSPQGEAKSSSMGVNFSTYNVPQDVSATATALHSFAEEMRHMYEPTTQHWVKFFIKTKIPSFDMNLSLYPHPISQARFKVHTAPHEGFVRAVNVMNGRGFKAGILTDNEISQYDLEIALLDVSVPENDYCGVPVDVLETLARRNVNFQPSQQSSNPEPHLEHCDCYNCRLPWLGTLADVNRRKLQTLNAVAKKEPLNVPLVENVAQFYIKHRLASVELEGSDMRFFADLADRKIPERLANIVVESGDVEALLKLAANPYTTKKTLMKLVDNNSPATVFVREKLVQTFPLSEIFYYIKSKLKKEPSALVEYAIKEAELGKFNRH